MRLHILGDLHLEFGSTRIPSPNSDVVVLTGDIHLGREGRKWIRTHFRDKPVVYVLGNHEFYRHAYPELIETLKQETEGSNIHVLENSAVVIDGFTFLGCTLWTDFMVASDPVAAMNTAAELMGDYTLVRNSAENRLLCPSDTVRAHQKSVAWLEEALAKSDPARTVVVTHHAPSRRSQAALYANNPLNGAFFSHLDSLVERSRIPLWVHGHTHHNVDYQIGSTRVLTNQRGYPDQLCKNFDPALVIEV